MSQLYFENVYQEAVKLPYKDQLNLISKLAASLKKSKLHNKHKLSEFKGLGKDLWQNINVNSYITDLREEWDER